MSIEQQLINAASRGNASQFKRIFKENKGVINVNATDANGSTALQHASMNGCLDIVTFLTNLPNIDLNHQDQSHATALIYAAKSNRAAVVKQLLSKREKIHVNLCNHQGFTALHFASFHGFTRVVHLLLGHPNIDTSIRDIERKTASEIAEQQGHIDVQHIIEHRLLEKSRSQRMLKQQSLHTIFGLGGSTAPRSRPSLLSAQPFSSSRLAVAESAPTSSPSTPSSLIVQEEGNDTDGSNVSEIQRRLKQVEEELEQSKHDFAQLQSLNAKLSAQVDLQTSQMEARLAVLEQGMTQAV